MTREYYSKNKLWIRAKRRKLRLENLLEVRKRDREYRFKNRKKIRERDRQRYLNRLQLNRDRKNKWARLARKENPFFRMVHRIRSQINRALNRKRKAAPTFVLVGCSLPRLVAHLELKFRPGMTWGNRGVSWQIDHIRPIASFDLSDPKQQKECFHFSNLQPLFNRENLIKGSSYDK